MKCESGGITVYLAIVYLSIIVFACSIVEVTRINIMKAEAHRSMISASESVLGGYDTFLKDHYGLFARSINYADVAYVNVDDMAKIDEGLNIYDSSIQDPLTRDYLYYSQSNSRNNPEDLRESMIDALFFSENKAYWNLTKSHLVDLTVSYPKRLFDQQTGDVSYVKKDMESYMNYRVPMTMLYPFIDKLEAMEKVGKTSSFLKEKNELVKDASTIESDYIKLYRLIEGIEIDEKSGEIQVGDDPFIKGVLGVENEEKYPEDYINKIIEEQLGHKLQSIQSILYQFEEQLNNSDDAIGKVGDFYTEVSELQTRIDELASRLRPHELQKISLNQQITANWSTIRTLSRLDPIPTKSIEALEKQIKVMTFEVQSIELEMQIIEKQLEPLQQQLNTAKKGVYDYTKKILTSEAVTKTLINEVQSLTDGDKSYLALNREAIKLINQMEETYEEVGKKIDDFVDTHEKNHENYMESTYKQSMNELEQLKNDYDQSFDMTNNLQFMKKECEGNVVLLEGLKEKVSLMESAYNKYMGKAFVEQKFDTNTIRELHRLYQSYGDYANVYGFLQPYLNYGTDVNSSGQYLRELKDTIEYVSESMKGYSRCFYFDYSNYKEVEDIQKGKESALSKLQGLKEIVSSLEFSKVFEDIPPVEVDFFNNIPSSYYINGMEEGSQKSFDLSYEDQGGEEQFYEQSEGMGHIKTLAMDFKEQLFLNEYAIGMFCAYPDRKNDEALTLSGYSKSSHVLDTEVEYILTGKKDALDSLQIVLMMIFGLRVVCNMIHLMTDATKRTMIINLSNAIAGWWSLGAGAIVVTILLTLLWASAESMVDLMLLVNSRKVPLIKVASTWYTSLDGNKMDLIDLGAELAEESVVKLIDVGSGEISRVISESSALISETTKKVYEEQVLALYEEGKYVIEAEEMLFENQFHIALDDYMLAYKSGQVETFELGDYFGNGTASYQLLALMIKDLQSEILKDDSSNGLIKAKKAVMEKYKHLINNQKITHKVKAMGDLDKEILAFGNEVSEKIEVLAQQGKEMSTDFIKEKKKTYLEKIKKKEQENVMPSGKKTLLDYVPAMGYHDYLRVFMLMDYKNLELRVYRMLDLIEMNMIEAKKAVLREGEASQRLSSYIVSTESEGVFEGDIGVFLLPFVKYRRRFAGKNYQFTVKVANGYD